MTSLPSPTTHALKEMTSATTSGDITPLEWGSPSVALPAADVPTAATMTPATGSGGIARLEALKREPLPIPTTLTRDVPATATPVTVTPAIAPSANAPSATATQMAAVTAPNSGDIARLEMLERELRARLAGVKAEIEAARGGSGGGGHAGGGETEAQCRTGDEPVDGNAEEAKIKLESALGPNSEPQLLSISPALTSPSQAQSQPSQASQTPTPTRSTTIPTPLDNLPTPSPLPTFPPSSLPPPSPSPYPPHHLLLLSDSALPLGSFAFSSSLESYLTHLHPRTSLPIPATTLLPRFLTLTLLSLATTTLPYVIASHTLPPLSSSSATTQTLLYLDDHLDASTTCPVTRRASVAQGTALLTVWSKALSPTLVSPFDSPRTHTALEAYRSSIRVSTSHGHLGVAWGAVCRACGLSLQATCYVFLFNHVKAVLSAAVRLNLIGPYVSQMLLASRTTLETIERALVVGWKLGVEEAGQSVPTLEVYGGRHELLYSRVFNS